MYERSCPLREDYIEASPSSPSPLLPPSYPLCLGGDARAVVQQPGRLFLPPRQHQGAASTRSGPPWQRPGRAGRKGGREGRRVAKTSARGCWSRERSRHPLPLNVLIQSSPSTHPSLPPSLSRWPRSRRRSCWPARSSRSWRRSATTATTRASSSPSFTPLGTTGGREGGREAGIVMQITTTDQ